MLASVVLSESFMLVCPNVNIHIVFWFLLDFPILVFFLVFFFGQHLTCGVLGPRFWVDRLCVDQTDETTKAEGIAALPTIVANSSDLLVFWDKSYCERLLVSDSSKLHAQFERFAVRSLSKFQFSCEEGPTSGKCTGMFLEILSALWSYKQQGSGATLSCRSS